MKIFITCIALLLVVESSFAQQINSLKTLTRDEYLKRSIIQKTSAKFLAGTGAAILIGAFTSVKVSETNKSKGTYPVIPGILGAGCLTGSVALFKASAQNKQRAIDLYVNVEKYSAPIPQVAPTTIFFPSFLFRLKIN